MRKKPLITANLISYRYLKLFDVELENWFLGGFGLIFASNSGFFLALTCSFLIEFWGFSMFLNLVFQHGSFHIQFDIFCRKWIFLLSKTGFRIAIWIFFFKASLLNVACLSKSPIPNDIVQLRKSNPLTDQGAIWFDLIWFDLIPGASFCFLPTVSNQEPNL